MMQMKKEYFIATWQRSAATRGNLSLGSITTVFPAAIAGPRREHSPNIGHWAGAVIPTTPTGSFCSQGEEQNLSAQAAAMNSRCSDVSTWSRWRFELELVRELEWGTRVSVRVSVRVRVKVSIWIIVSVRVGANFYVSFTVNALT